MLPEDCDDDLVFFGGKGYQPFFQRLSQNHRGKRIVYCNSSARPKLPGCELGRYKTTAKTRWQYECAAAFIVGTMKLFQK